MKVLAIVGTPRRNGLVSSLCQRILDGAEENGHQVEMVNLYDYDIGYCRGCWGGAKLGRCILKDDHEKVLEKLREAEVVILGSPIYWSDVSGIMKNFFDRQTAYMNIFPGGENYYKLPTKEKFKTMLKASKNFGPKEHEFRNKKFILVTACTSPFPVSHLSKEVPQTLYVMKMYAKKMKGKVIAKLVYTDTLFKFLSKKEQKIMEKAYKTGKQIK